MPMTLPKTSPMTSRTKVLCACAAALILAMVGAIAPATAQFPAAPDSTPAAKGKKGAAGGHPGLHHAVAARDDDAAVAIVSEHATTRILSGDGATVARWISQLPRARVENDIDLLILQARALTSEYALDEAAGAIDRAEQLLTSANRDRYAVVLLSLRGMLEGLRGELERSIDTLERAMARFDENDFWFSMTSLHLGIAALMLPDLRKAELHLGRTTGHRDVDGPLTAVIGQCYGGLCRLWRGDSEQAMRMAHEANQWIDAWDAKHATGRPLASLTHCLLSDAERMRNNLDPARDFAQLALEFGKQGFLIGYVEASRALAQVAEAQGDWDVALTAAKEASLGAMWVETQDCLSLARALEYSVRWRRWQVTANREDFETVTRWCRESELLDPKQWRRRMQPGLCPDYSLLIGARVLLHLERYEEAQQLLDALAVEALRTERLPGQISALILRSLAEGALGRGDTAVNTMQRAIEIAARPRFSRLFLDEGSAVLPLIERAAPRAADRDFALRVLSAFEVPVKLRPAVAGIEEPLSGRELEVLRLIAAGASNQAAARKLFVAPSTVKKHLQNIYVKLGVGGRTHAVARARELQIL